SNNHSGAQRLNVTSGTKRRGQRWPLLCFYERRCDVARTHSDASKGPNQLIACAGVHTQGLTTLSFLRPIESRRVVGYLPSFRRIIQSREKHHALHVSIDRR